MGRKGMKLAIFLLLFSFTTWARPIVLLGYFDPFGKAPFNSAERVANLLFEKTKDHPDFELRLCRLNTVFDKSFYQIERCLVELPQAPAMVLGLGESNCNLKIETLGRNLDKTKGADNEGNERNNTPIITNGPKEIGFNYPLPQMFCALNADARARVQVSNNAGSFVCNNLAYQFAEKYVDTVFGFIHVPSHNCKGLDEKSRFATNSLEKMLQAAVKTSGATRLPTTKDELEALRKSSPINSCLREFYKRAKGVDERKFWPFEELR
jgi:pyrrolidone-carboxylate peptidase